MFRNTKLNDFRRRIWDVGEGVQGTRNLGTFDLRRTYER